MDSCARADSAEAEAAWPIIEAAMRHQRPPGDYESATIEARNRQLERTTWWMAQLCRADVAVMNSPLQKRFSWRVTLLLPKIRRSIDWLVAAGEEIIGLHAKRPDLLLVDAEAFLLADGIYHEPRMAELGQRALATALRAQSKDGALVADRKNVGGQARALTGLVGIAMYFLMPSLDEAAQRAAQLLERGLAGRVGDSSARTEHVEALAALATQAGRVKDRGLASRVERLAREIVTHRER